MIPYLILTSTTGASGFADAWGAAVTADNLWSSLIPFVGVMTAIFIFAFAYRVFHKTTKSGSKGKFND